MPISSSKNVPKVGNSKKAESWLYIPIKQHLEALGFTAKGEIGFCDFVAVGGSNSVSLIVGELKPTFTLDLVLQGVDRASACDEIWLVVGMSKRGAGRENDHRVHKLCRRLGFGLFGISEAGEVHVLVAPGPYHPRSNAKRRSELLDEHRRQQGDPVLGGSSTASPMMTAYRQGALAVARALESGPKRPRDLRIVSPTAQSFLSKNYYGWFVAVERGWYALTDEGRSALRKWTDDERFRSNDCE